MAIQAPVRQPVGLIADPQDFIDSLDASSFSYRDIQGRDVWTSWSPSFSSLTTVGTLSTSGRYRIVGRQLFFSVKLYASTSIASTAGTTALTLPVPCLDGSVGSGTMVNLTTFVAVGTCVIVLTNCAMPTQGASANTFGLAGWYEI